uniref:Uncharacterized protein n=1 Tax=Anopheles albimanus TaxID=7167 RepID=A0A182FWQ9_ANOAL
MVTIIYFKSTLKSSGHRSVSMFSGSRTSNNKSPNCASGRLKQNTRK